MSTHADRTSPISPDGTGLGSLPGAHIVQFYNDDAVLMDEAGRLFGSTLGAGGAAIMLGTPAHRHGIAARLEAMGLDLDRLGGSGRFIALDAAEALTQILVDGRVDERRFAGIIGGHIRRATDACVSGTSRLAIFGELVALLAAEGEHDTAVELERCWNELAEEYPFTLLCGYPMGAFGRPEDIASLVRVCDAHTTVAPVETFPSLASDDAQSRTIVQLQQKAAALEHEVAKRAFAEQALLERNKELQAAVMARDEFVTVAAHELRTPLTGLRGHAQMLLRNIQSGRAIGPERVAASVAIIDRQSRQLGLLIGRLLDASQIESGKLQTALANTDLALLAQAVIAQQPPHDMHKIQFEGPDHLYFPVDPPRFEQVIANLVDNAVRYSPDGGQVLVGLADRGPSGVELSVTDAGIGIPPNLRDAVFTRFRQAHPDDRYSGIGLGLFISREIVELHGGSMRIESPESGGTRVVVTLPRMPDRESG